VKQTIIKPFIMKTKTLDNLKLVIAEYGEPDHKTTYAFDYDDNRLRKLTKITTLTKKIKSYISDNGFKATIWQDASGVQYEVFHDRSCKPLIKK
jgi:hypothetical protein